MNFKVMQIVMQREFPFCARREREFGEAGPWSRFAGGAVAGGAPGASSGAGPEGRGKLPRAAGCFWSGSPGGMQGSDG